MSDKPLLPLSVNSGNLTYTNSRGWRIAVMTVGIFVLLFGAADVTTRIAHSVFGSNASLYSFAPAVALLGTYNADNTSASATPLVPVRLLVPAIGVDAAVEQVGKKEDGSMGTPTKFGNVGWYALGSAPGQPGNAVIDGHVNNALTKAGVFEHLSQLALGDTVTVVNASGTQMSFIVTKVEEYPADTAPAASIFTTTGPPGLVLITCDGDWVQSARSFDKRLVVFARLK